MRFGGLVPSDEILLQAANHFFLHFFVLEATLRIIPDNFPLVIRAATRISVRGYTLKGRPRLAQGSREFSKIWQIFLQLQEGIILPYFSRKFKNPALIFRALCEKYQVSGKGRNAENF